MISHQSHDNVILYINNQLIEKTSKFKHLGSILNNKCEIAMEKLK